MSEVFAGKLRRWLASVMTLLLGTISASIATLLDRPCTTSDAWNCIGMSGQAMVPFLILLPTLAVWHASDFMQNRRPRGWLAALLASYSLLFGMLSLLLLLHVLNATGRFLSVRECGGLFVLLSQGCLVTDRWLLRPMLALLLLLPLLALAKGVFVIHSRLPKRS